MKGRLLAIACCAASIALISCELITKRSGLQCETNGDCQARGGAFAQTVCTNAGVCEPVLLPESTPTTGCNSEACSIRLHAPARCVDATCLSLNPSPSGLCVTIGPVNDDNAVILGVLLPQSGEAAAVSTGLGNIAGSKEGGEVLLDYVLSNWNFIAKALTPPAPQFAAVVCDESQLMASLNFFVELHPPIILGPVSGVALSNLTTMDAFKSTAIFSPLGDAQVFYTPSPSLSRWFCSPNRGGPTPVVRDFQSAIDLVSQFVAAQPGRGGSGPGQKLAFVRNSAEPNESEFWTSVKTGLTFNHGTETPGTILSNGKPAYADFDINEDVTQSVALDASVAELIATFAPDVIVMTGPVWADDFSGAIEGRWQLEAKGHPRPTYLVYRKTDGLAKDGAATDEPLNKAPALGAEFSRLFSFDTVPDANLSANLQVLEGMIESGLQPGDSYVEAPFQDCLYAAMYSAAAGARLSGSPAGSLTGPDIAKGVARVTQETTTTNNLTLMSVTTELPELNISDPNPTELIGASVYLGLDPSTGVPSMAAPTQGFGIYCLGGADAPVRSGWNFAGVSYDPEGHVTAADGGTSDSGLLDSGSSDGATKEGGTKKGKDAGSGELGPTVIACPF